jgi:hypothetical protein
MPQDDAKIAGIARQLAEALSAAGYTRKDEDKKRVAMLHVSLCAAVRAEATVVDIKGEPT